MSYIVVCAYFNPTPFLLGEQFAFSVVGEISGWGSAGRLPSVFANTWLTPPATPLEYPWGPWLVPGLLCLPSRPSFLGALPGPFSTSLKSALQLAEATLFCLRGEVRELTAVSNTIAERMTLTLALCLCGLSFGFLQSSLGKSHI